jgi:hypothetical protein
MLTLWISSRDVLSREEMVAASGFPLRPPTEVAIASGPQSQKKRVEDNRLTSTFNAKYNAFGESSTA